MRKENEVIKELKDEWIGEEVGYLTFLDIGDYHISTHLLKDVDNLKDGKYTEVLKGSYAHYFPRNEYEVEFQQNTEFIFKTVGEWEVEDGQINTNDLTIKIIDIEEC